MSDQRPLDALWVVVSVDSTPPAVEGFLITDHARMPRLIAFVAGYDDVAALGAWRIAQGHRSPEMADDLRGRPVPDWLLRKAIIPVESTPDALSGIGGIFTRTKDGFFVFTVVKTPQLAGLARKTAVRLSAVLKGGNDVV